MILKNMEEIKPPTLSCHAAAVAYHKEEPIYAWFGGTREGASDVKIYIRYKKKGYPLRLAVNKDLPAWNPVFMQIQDQLYLFFKMGTFCDSWQTFLLELNFNDKDALEMGRTLILPAGFNGPVKTRPLVDDNTVYCGSSVETHFKWTSYIETMTLEDGSWSYDRTPPLRALTGRPMKGIIQPVLWMEGDKLHAVFRSSKDSGYMWHAHQDDNLNWQPALATHIPNPNSGVDVVQHSNGKRYLIYNPSATERTPLSIAEFEVTATGRLNIVDELLVDEIEDAADWSLGTPEVSYPYAIEAPTGDITIMYTHRRKTIRVATVVL